MQNNKVYLMEMTAMKNSNNGLQLKIYSGIFILVKEKGRYN
ncbi:hypothetical protein MPF_1585 [Methanohalophilus portucalensis FDF-1]|uniref:Uncharacterized protein n=1 Tax=Methanohalophilus portucalensis FDF-1 TaxID=523843 RepID=A0A1L9C3Q6_9EURY|nr:hypothetical protein MPF_1585 [Methanohalophilus portucalensis FDF-1]